MNPKNLLAIGILASLSLVALLQFASAQVMQNENVLLKGTGSPNPIIGNNGDFYIDNTNGQYYQKNNGVWLTSNAQAAQGVIAEQGGSTSVQGGTLSPNPYSNPSYQPVQPLPPWMKNIAGLWASGQISDDEFVRAIQYLVSVGIIRV
jgi:hypothetical protein